MGMGIALVTRQPFSRRVTGMERNGEVGMVTLAHQVTPSKGKWSSGDHVHPPSVAMSRIFLLLFAEERGKGMDIVMGIVSVTRYPLFKEAR